MSDTRTAGRIPVYTAPYQNTHALMMGKAISLLPPDLERLSSEGRVLAQRAHDALPGVFQEVGESGRAFFGSLVFEPGQIPNAPRAVVFVAPTGGEGVTIEWLRLERLPWETLCDAIGPIAKDRGIVRASGDKAPPPIQFGARRLKVLLVRASPRGAADPVPDALALEPLREVIELHHPALRPTLRVIEGPDTLEQIDALLQEDPVWDIVHLAMHAEKRQRLLLEDSAGDTLPLPFESFPARLESLQGVRLFVLGVCGSSPLAVRLSCYFPEARILSLLHDTSQRVVTILLRRFYEHLLGRRQDRRAVYVEDAFRAAVSHLHDERLAEWFLPVLYGPEGLVPMLDVQEYHRLRAVLQSVDDQRQEQARAQLRGLLESRQVRLRDIAHQVEQELDRVEHAASNLRALDRQLEHQTRHPREGGWDALGQRWDPTRDITQPARMGAVVQSTAPPQEALFTARAIAACQAHYRTGAMAIRDLSSFYSGDLGRLLPGFENLSSYGSLRANQRLQAAAPGFLLAHLEDLLGGLKVQIKALVAEGQPDRARLLEALLGLREVERGLRTLRANDPDRHPAEEFDRDLGAAIDACASLVEAGAAPPLPEGLLEPERRLELLLWMEGDAPAAAARPSTRDLDRLIASLDAQGATQAGGAGGARAAALDEPSLVGNTRAPVRLALDLADARHPFLELAAFGVSPACSRDDLKNRASYDIGELKDPRSRDELHHTLDALLDDRARIRIEAILLPCDDPKVLTERVQVVVQARLDGVSVPAGALEGVGVLDHAALMALGGQVVDASEQLWTLAQSDDPAFEHQHAAFLLMVHRAWRQRGETSGFLDAGRRAIALLGRLCVPQARSARWVSKRLAAWGGLMPVDLGEHLAAFRGALEERLVAVLERVSEIDQKHQHAAQLLQLELRAELVGAELLQDQREECGGYLGALYSGRLQRLARIAAQTFAHISPMDREEFQQWMIATGESRERFHQRIFLLSDLRRAWASPSAATVALLDPLLPSREDLESGTFWPPDSLLELMRQDSFEHRYPFHHLAGGGEPQLLMVHAAMVAARCHLEAARELLAAERVGLARLSAHLDRVRNLALLVERVGYSPGGEPPRGLVPRVEELLAEWMRGLRSEFFESRGPGGEWAAFNLRVKAHNHLLKRLARRYEGVLGVTFSQLQAELLLCEAVYYVHNEADAEYALKQVREAMRLYPSYWEVMAVFIDAEVLRAATWEMEGETERARSALRAALGRVRRWLELYSRWEIEQRAAAMAAGIDDPLPASSIATHLQQLSMKQDDDHEESS